MKKLRITVSGTVYDVTVEALDEAPVGATLRTPLPASTVAMPVATSAPTPAPTAGPAAGGGVGVVISPLAGKVVSIEAAIGTSVQAGATLIVLEAMKMNTVIGAPMAGRVTEVMVKPGDAVEEGQPLLRIA